jgi:hypothetical protein
MSGPLSAKVINYTEFARAELAAAPATKEDGRFNPWQSPLSNASGHLGAAIARARRAKIGDRIDSAGFSRPWMHLPTTLNPQADRDAADTLRAAGSIGSRTPRQEHLAPVHQFP